MWDVRGRLAVWDEREAGSVGMRGRLAVWDEREAGSVG